MNVDQKRTTLVLMGARFAWTRTKFHTEYIMLINGRQIESGTNHTMSRVPLCLPANRFYGRYTEVDVSEVPDKWVMYLYRHMDLQP